jgi:hypothetical protein
MGKSTTGGYNSTTSLVVKDSQTNGKVIAFLEDIYHTYPPQKKNFDEATCSSAKTFDKQDFTFQQALSSKEGDLWRTAIHDEYAPLMKNKTWEFSNHVMEEHQSNVDGYLTLRPDMNEFRNAIRPA